MPAKPGPKPGTGSGQQQRQQGGGAAAQPASAQPASAAAADRAADARAVDNGASSSAAAPAAVLSVAGRSAAAGLPDAAANRPATRAATCRAAASASAGPSSIAAPVAVPPVAERMQPPHCDPARGAPAPQPPPPAVPVAAPRVAPIPRVGQVAPGRAVVGGRAAGVALRARDEGERVFSLSLQLPCPLMQHVTQVHHIGTQLGDELRAMGLTPRSAPAVLASPPAGGVQTVTAHFVLPQGDAQRATQQLTGGLGGVWVRPLGAQQRVLAHMHIAQGPLYLFTVRAEHGSYAPDALSAFLHSDEHLLQGMQVLWLGRTSLCGSHVDERCDPAGAVLPRCAAPDGLAPRSVIGLAVGGQRALHTPVVVPSDKPRDDDTLFLRRLPNRAAAQDAQRPGSDSGAANGGAPRAPPPPATQPSQPPRPPHAPAVAPARSPSPAMPPAGGGAAPGRQAAAVHFTAAAVDAAIQRASERQLRRQASSSRPSSPPVPPTLAGGQPTTGLARLPRLRTQRGPAPGDRHQQRKVPRIGSPPGLGTVSLALAPRSPAAMSEGSSLRLSAADAVDAPDALDSDGSDAYGGGYDADVGHQHDELLSAQLNVRSLSQPNAAPLPLPWGGGGHSQ